MRFTHQPGAQPLAGYTIHRGIHRGGFGEVYYARSDGGKEVALKLLQREQDVELRGVRQCLNLKHPNLVSLFDVRTDCDGEQWVVMEYVNGTSLEDVLTTFPKGLPLDEVEQWLSGIVAGVTYLHDRGIVHRDLKPANVYCENGTVKVGDVGLSKRLGNDRRAAHTQSVGTVYYMAPEVANGQYGPGVDIYSLGVMLYEMLTGQLPFMGESTGEVLMKHLTSPPDLKEIPAPLRPVVANALAKDPTLRTQSALDVNQQFQAGLSLLRKSINQSAGSMSPVGSPSNSSCDPLSVTPARTSAKFDTSIPGDPVTVASRGVANSVSGLANLVSPPLPTRTAAQAASAYAQYPSTKSILENAASLESIPSSSPSSSQSPSAGPAKPKATTRPRPPRRSIQESFSWQRMVMIAIALILFAPGTSRAWTGFGLICAALGITRLLRGRNGRRLDTSSVSVDPSVEVEVCRSHDFRQLLGDISVSLAVGGVSACLMAMGCLLATEFAHRWSPKLTPEFCTLFTLISLIAAWLILCVHQIRNHSRWVKLNSRKTNLLVGIIVGGLAGVMHQYLLVDMAPSPGYSPAFSSLGVHRLVEGMNPTILGYVLFFGGVMFLHRWALDLSPARLKQLQLPRLAAAGFIAWILTNLFAFPQTPGVLWAVVISAAVQLATPSGIPDRRTARTRC